MRFGKGFSSPFTTRRSQGGSGLGTHVVRNLITERFGGTIAVTTEVGVGTVWTFNLPIGTAALSLNQEDNRENPPSDLHGVDTKRTRTMALRQLIYTSELSVPILSLRASDGS